MNVSVISPPSKNYFLLIGDWGAHDQTSSDVAVQTAIAKKMLSFYEKQKSNGYNLLFVGTVGDNFYYDGQTCAYWKSRWTDMYGEIATNYPWLAVFGNHDWGKDDPGAMCAWGVPKPKYINPVTNIPYDANQINSIPTKGCNPKNYYLPDFGYYYTIPELNFEWIALEETATICPSDMGGSTYDYCDHSSKVGCDYLGRMKDASEQMMNERATNSTMNNFILSQHYPQNGKRLVDTFKKLRNPKQLNYTVWSVYGHTHRQHCDRTEGNFCDSILTGGGGGCCSEDTLRGFYVIGFDDNKRMTQPYKINDPEISCQYPCRAELTNDEIVHGMFDHCCYTDSEENCKLFDLSRCKKL